MADFSYLKKLDVTEQSEAEYTFDDIPGEPSIWFRPMTDANPDYLNERVRIAVDRAEKEQQETKKKRREKILSTDRLEDDREIDRLLMARTCAVRWGNAPKDINGDQPEFSAQNCLDFLRALPNYMFDPCRGFVSNVYNFVDRSALKGTVIDPDKTEDLGNATQSG